MTDDSEFFPSCAVGCGFFWAIVGGFAGLTLFIVFGVFALVPAGPFEERDNTTGIILVVLGATGISTLGGYLLVGLPCAGVGFLIDKAVSQITMVAVNYIEGKNGNLWREFNYGTRLQFHDTFVMSEMSTNLRDGLSEA